MKKIAMLLNGEIINDYRVIKIINSLSKRASIDLFYTNGDVANDSKLFEKNVSLISVNHKNNFFVNFLRHTFFCFEFNFFLKKVLNQNKLYDWVWANDLPTLYPAYKISKKLNSKLVYDSHEIYIETLNQFFPKKSNCFKKLIFKIFLFVMKTHGKRVERKIIQKTYRFLTVNESLLNYFQNLYNLKYGCAILNCPRIDNYKNNINNFDLKKKLQINPNLKVVIYQGVFNEGRGLRILIEAFLHLNDNYILFLVGEGTLKNELETIIKNLKLENRIYINFDNFEENFYTSIADLGVNLLEPLNLSKMLASPNKVFQYIQAGIPVILSKSPENMRILEKYKIGLLTDLNSKDIANSIVEVVCKNDASFKQEIEKAKNIYNWQVEELKLFDYLD